MDSFILRAITKELNEKITGGRIFKIYQPVDSDIFLRIRTRGVSSNLIISSHPEWKRIHLTETRPDNPFSPPSFCMLLRKFIEGGTLLSVQQEGLERIVIFEIGYKDKKYHLVAELIGKQGCILLTDEEKTVLGLSPSSRSGERLSLGKKYQPPPFEKADPLTIPKELFLKKFPGSPAKEVWRELLDHFRGISPQTAREIAYRAMRKTAEPRLWEAFTEIFGLVREESFSPSLHSQKKESLFILSAIPLNHLETSERAAFSSVNEAAEKYFGTVIPQKDFIRLKQSLSRQLKKELSRAKKAEEALKREREKYQEWDQFKLYGEMILAHLHTVVKGMDNAVLKNYYSPEQELLTISLDVTLSPQQNAEKYFKKYKKAQRGIKIVEERLKKIKETAGKYEKSLESLADVKEPEELGKLCLELEKRGLVKEGTRTKPKQKKKETAVPYRKYHTRDGWMIFTGKSAKGNDYLTSHIGREDDIWLHAQNTSGSHVIIKKKKRGENIPQHILIRGAELAAYYSRAKASSKIPVAYTELRHVKRFKGKKPGAVTLLSYKTIMATPSLNARELKEIC